PLPFVPERPDPSTFPPYEANYDTPDPWQREPEGGLIPQEVWDEQPALDVYRALIAGDLPSPPIHHFTGGRFTEVEEGRAAFVQPATEWLNSPARALYGGA